MKSEKHIRVLLAEDHTIVREGLKSLLGLEKDIQVVGEADTGRFAVEMALKLNPDVIIMDIAMPELNGFEATRQILEKLPSTKVLILSAHNDDVYVDRVLELGAVGYLIKQNSAHFLSEAIRGVANGETYFCPEVDKRLQRRQQDSLNSKGVSTAQASNLTPRELQVLQLVAEGSANKQVASVLNISIKTVEKHRDHIMRKLNIHETAGLTRYAIENHIIESRVQLTIL